MEKLPRIHRAVYVGVFLGASVLWCCVLVKRPLFSRGVSVPFQYLLFFVFLFFMFLHILLQGFLLCVCACMRACAPVFLVSPVIMRRLLVFVVVFVIEKYFFGFLHDCKTMTLSHLCQKLDGAPLLEFITTV